MIAGSIVICIILAFIIVANVLCWEYRNAINNYFGISEYELIKAENDDTDTEYIKSDYDSWDDLHTAAMAMSEEIEAEGMVLLENNGILPLGTNKKVSLFSVSSVNPVYGGTGSGSTDTSSAPTLKTAFENAGLEVNGTLWDFYTEQAETYQRELRDLKGNGEYKVNEMPIANLTGNGTVMDSLADYDDLAVVMISRSGGEGTDLTMSGSEESIDGESGYLTLTKNEKALLDELQSNSDVKDILILVNSASAMELGWLEDYSKIGAALWIGAPGSYGLNAVAKAVTGEVNPSGRLVDTYAYDSLSSPAATNFGEILFTNHERVDDLGELYMNETMHYTGSYYVVYLEGIYVGYKYYETRYEDIVLGQGNADQSAGISTSSGDRWNYTEEVQYPFGYGLSYTTFEYSDFNVTPSADGKSFEVKVTVTNTGDYTGREVVQIYAQQPYSDYDKENGIENASVQLAGFDKTEPLAPGEQQTVSVTVDKRDLTSYDSENAKTYVLDEGDYYLAVGKNSHDALNNILALKGKTTDDGMDYNGNSTLAQVAWTNTELDKTTYSTSEETGAEITNQFDHARIDNYYNGITFLTRSDWQGTYPELVELAITDELEEGIRAHQDPDDYDKSDYTMPTFGKVVDDPLTLVQLRGADYNDDRWDDLLDQMTKEEAIKLVVIGGFSTQGVPSIAYLGSSDADGPAGYSGAMVGRPEARTVSYPCEVVVASTFDTELVERQGRIIGNEGLAIDKTGWYAPGLNTHRTPYGGRNFEYYSEDGFIAGKMAAAVTRGASSKGLISYGKHFAVGDQESSRKGLVTFANEQCIREIYLKPFELAVTEGGSMGLMAAKNRLGTTWVAADRNLNINVLRGEWGFDGILSVDYLNSPRYQSALDAVIGGSDLTLCNNTSYMDSVLAEKDNPYVMTLVREHCKNILFTSVNSNAMNGTSPLDRVEWVRPAWQSALIACNVILPVVAVGLAAWMIVDIVRVKKANKK